MSNSRARYPFHWPIIAACVFVILIVGALVYRRDHVLSTPSNSFKTIVDRGQSAAEQAADQKKIDDQLALIAQTEKNGTRDISQYLTLGNLYYGAGDLAEAEQAYQNILDTNPNDAPALENLGQAQLESGNYGGAELSWTAALHSSPTDTGYDIRLANLIDQYDPTHEATIGPLLESAISSNGQTPDLLYRLGQWYEKNGQYAEAMSQYQVAYELADKDPSIEQTINELQQKMVAAQAAANAAAISKR